MIYFVFPRHKRQLEGNLEGGGAGGGEQTCDDSG